MSRQTRMHTSIIYHQPNILFYLCFRFFSHHRSSTMGSFGFHYSDVVINIEHIVADGISNENAHGLSRNEFTSPFCFISIFTIRILFAILSEVRTTFSFQISKRKRMMKKTFINISYTRKVRFRTKIHGQTSDHVWSFRSSPFNTLRRKKS